MEQSRPVSRQTVEEPSKCHCPGLQFPETFQDSFVQLREFLPTIHSYFFTCCIKGFEFLNRALTDYNVAIPYRALHSNRYLNCVCFLSPFQKTQISLQMKNSLKG